MSVNGTALLGMPGFEVVAAELVRGEWELLVQTVQEPTGCPAYGAVRAAQDHRAVTVRDLPSGGVPVAIGWRTRVFSCRHALCEHHSWPEKHAAIAARAALTERALQWRSSRSDTPTGRFGISQRNSASLGGRS